MRKIIILGATGSVGNSALELIQANPEKFQIVGASSHHHFTELQSIAKDFSIPHLLNTNEKHYFPDFLDQCQPDIVLNAISGFAGLPYSIQILESGTPLALANKESLVAGGELLMALSRTKKTSIYPVDSEHSAIWQCLQNHDPGIRDLKSRDQKHPFKKILLTCSGGPFRERKDFSTVTKSEALTHPTWSMGGKITIDSATLANKCLEVFEAMHLFGASKDQIEIIIHPQSIVHSMVQFSDSSIIAQISPPNMKLPIAYALNYPNCDDYKLEEVDFSNLTLNFSNPDKKKFRTLQMLDICIREMQNFPIVFNAANEIAVSAFLEGKISFVQIFDVLEKIIDETKKETIETFEQIQRIDAQTRTKTQSLLP